MCTYWIKNGSIFQLNIAQKGNSLFSVKTFLFFCFRALRVRKKMCGKGQVINMIGDMLCENVSIPSRSVFLPSCITGPMDQTFL